MLNSVNIQGRLVADPELKKTQSGVSVTTIRIACDRDYVPRDGERQADFFNVTCWRGTAEFVCKYFRKGQMIIINGTLQSRSYDDRDGNRRYSVEIQADRVNFAGSKRESASEPYHDTENQAAYGGNANYSRGNGQNGQNGQGRQNGGRPQNRNGGTGGGSWANRNGNSNNSNNSGNGQNGRNGQENYDDSDLPF